MPIGRRKYVATLAAIDAGRPSKPRCRGIWCRHHCHAWRAPPRVKAKMPVARIGRCGREREDSECKADEQRWFHGKWSMRSGMN